MGPWQPWDLWDFFRYAVFLTQGTMAAMGPMGFFGYAVFLTQGTMAAMGPMGFFGYAVFLTHGTMAAMGPMGYFWCKVSEKIRRYGSKDGNFNPQAHGSHGNQGFFIIYVAKSITN